MFEAHSNGDTSPQAEFQTRSRVFLPILKRGHAKDVRTVHILRSIPVSDEDLRNSLKKQKKQVVSFKNEVVNQEMTGNIRQPTRSARKSKRLKHNKQQMDPLQEEVSSGLKDQKAPLEKALDFAELHPLAKEERLTSVSSMLEETVVRAALLDASLSAHSNKLEQSLSTHQSELKSASDLFDALDRQVSSELKDQNASFFKELEESLSTHESEVVSASDLFDALDRQVSELKDQSFTSLPIAVTMQAMILS
jgi:hypothetical protein